MTTKLTVWLAVAWCLLLASQKSLRFRMFIIENSVGDISVEWYWSLQRSMLQPAALLYQFCECFCRLLSGDWLWPCPMLAAATVDDAFFSWVSLCDAIPSYAMMDGNANSLLGLILLTMWYDNNILKPAHDRALSFFRKSIWLRRLGMEWNGKHRWWITSDWHTKIITHIFFSLLPIHSFADFLVAFVLVQIIFCLHWARRHSMCCTWKWRYFCRFCACAGCWVCVVSC